MTNKPLNDTIHRVTQRVLANSRDSRSATSGATIPHQARRAAKASGAVM